jgi:uncharacterized membrane protein YgaE (UPF0421/DUF939 family)
VHHQVLVRVGDRGAVVLALPGDQPWLVLLMAYIFTSLLSAAITNNAAPIFSIVIISFIRDMLSV